MECPICHRAVADTARRCDDCGAVLTPATTGATQRLATTMLPLPIHCPLCQSALEVGFVPEEGRSTTHPSVWVKGAPERSVWTGGVKWRDRRVRQVMTYRCTGCGYLLAFAREPTNLEGFG